MKRYVQFIFLPLCLLYACGDDDDDPEDPIPPQLGLVAEYLLDGNALDSAGNNDGTLIGGPGTALDRFGRPGHALAFDGVDDCIETVEDDFSQDSQVSVSFWFTVPSLSTSANNVALSSDFVLFIDGDEAGMSIATDLYSCSESAVFGGANTWHHLLATYDGINISLYLDGGLVGANNCPGVISDQNRPLTLGCFGATHWVGNLDDVRIYNRSITSAEEISALYHEGGYGL